MADDRWSRIRELFEQARDLPAAERRAALDSLDPTIRRELESLLAAHDTASGFLADRASPAAGAQVGPYRLIEPIGEGGFAVVYLAEQETPIRRRVALKLIKPGMDSRPVIARFEAERQALALMAHPGIAQVWDAGETDDGRPYFAMEHVAGVAITTFADTAQLSLRERLGLFLEVCDAIQHAHQKGVIHRDIKPSNVLVMRDVGARVIDFGIAKAIGETSLGGPAMTREGMIIGTAGYMSPEQLGAIKAPVDTRSDIYSLGVLLYELLAGDLPFDRDRLRNATWPEAMQMVLTDPPTPAEQAARSDTGERAGKRSTDARTLLRALKGELEWITLKAMEREPERRYASASELAADIRRYLADEPVLAAAPGALYRGSKFVRRHRVGVAAAAVVLLTIILGGVAAGIGFRRAVVAERAARREAESANQVAAFMVGLFHTSGPGGNPDSLTARALLDRGFAQAPPADPLVRARLFGAISDSYLNLEEFDAGMKSAHAALDAAESARPRDDVEVARYLDKLANAYSMAGLVDSIPPLADRAIALLSASARGDKALLASSYYRKAKLAMNAQRLEEADSLLALAIASLDRAPEPADASLLTRIHSSRGTLASWRTQNDMSLAEYRRALAYSVAANEPMREAGLQSLLASTFVNLGRPDSAVVHAQIGVDMARRLYAPDHNALANALGRLAEAQVARGHYREAIAAEEEAVRILRSKPRKGDALAFEVATLGSIHQSAGNLEDAIRLTSEALDLYREADGPDHFRVGEAMANLASDESLAGHVKAADDHFHRAIAVLEANHDESIVLPVARLNYGNLCIDQGRLADAESLFARAWNGLDSSNVAMRGYCGDVLMGRARVRARQGKEAGTLARAALPLRRGTLPENDPQLLDTWLSMAEVEKLTGQPEASAQMLARARRSGATEKDLARYPALGASFVSSR